MPTPPRFPPKHRAKRRLTVSLARYPSSPFVSQGSDEPLVGADDSGAGRPSASSMSRVPFNVSSASDTTFGLPGDELVRSRQKVK